MPNNYGNSVVSVVNAYNMIPSISSNTTLSANSYNRAYLITGSYTVMLPLISSGAPRNYVLFINDTSGATAVIATQGSDGIRVKGSPVTSINLPAGESVILENNGTTWSTSTTAYSKAGLNAPTFTGGITVTGGNVVGNVTGQLTGLMRDVNGDVAQLSGGYFLTKTTSGAAIQNAAGDVNLFLVDSNGNATAHGNVTAYSDARLKSNVKTIENSLDVVDELRGVSYTRDGKAGIGVIAQEVQKVLPELVMEDEKGYLSVAYGNLVGVLIEAIKELRLEVKALKGE